MWTGNNRIATSSFVLNANVGHRYVARACSHQHSHAVDAALNEIRLAEEANAWLRRCRRVAAIAAAIARALVARRLQLLQRFRPEIVEIQLE